MIIRNSTIGSNGGDGIEVVDSVEIEQSFIGTTAGADDRGNAGAGIRLRHQSFPDATGVITGNAIALNDGPGIAVVDALTGHRTFRENLIHDNGGIAIDLGDDGSTAVTQTNRRNATHNAERCILLRTIEFEFLRDVIRTGRISAELREGGRPSRPA